MKRETKKVSSLYVILGCLFVTCLLISNIIAGKLISVFGMVLPAAVILFPVGLHLRRHPDRGLRI
jgi:uncharacterized PurR-regulated membrane protein YhhQ (DUF165 family)